MLSCYDLSLYLQQLDSAFLLLWGPDIYIHCPLDSFSFIHCRNWTLKTPQNKFITFVSNLLLLLYCVFQWMALKYIHPFKPKAGASALLSGLSSSFTHQKADNFSLLIHLLYLSMSFHTEGHFPCTVFRSSLNYSYSFIVGLLDFSLAHHRSKLFSENSRTYDHIAV